MDTVLLLVNTVACADLLSSYLGGEARQKGLYQECIYSGRKVIVFPVEGKVLRYAPLPFAKGDFLLEALPEEFLEEHLELPVNNKWAERNKIKYDAIRDIVGGNHIEKVIVAASYQDKPMLSIALSLLDEFKIGCAVSFVCLTSLNKSHVLSEIDSAILSKITGRGKWEDIGEIERVVDEIGYILGSSLSYLFKSKVGLDHSIDFSLLQTISLIGERSDAVVKVESKKHYGVIAETDSGKFIVSGRSGGDDGSLETAKKTEELVAGETSILIDVTHENKIEKTDEGWMDGLGVALKLVRKGHGVLDELWGTRHSVLDELYNKGIISCPSGSNISCVSEALLDTHKEIMQHLGKTSTAREQEVAKLYKVVEKGVEFYPCTLLSPFVDEDLLTGTEREIVGILREEILAHLSRRRTEKEYVTEGTLGGCEVYMNSSQRHYELDGKEVSISDIYIEEKPRYSGLQHLTREDLYALMSDREIARGVIFSSILDKMISHNLAYVSGRYILLTKKGEYLYSILPESFSSLLVSFKQTIKKRSSSSQKENRKKICRFRNQFVSFVFDSISENIASKPYIKSNEESSDASVIFCPSCGSSLIDRGGRVECSKREWVRGEEKGCKFVIWKKVDNSSVRYILTLEDIKRMLDGNFANIPVEWKKSGKETVVPCKINIDDGRAGIEFII